MRKLTIIIALSCFTMLCCAQNAITNESIDLKVGESISLKRTKPCTLLQQPLSESYNEFEQSAYRVLSDSKRNLLKADSVPARALEYYIMHDSYNPDWVVYNPYFLRMSNKTLREVLNDSDTRESIFKCGLKLLGKLCTIYPSDFKKTVLGFVETYSSAVDTVSLHKYTIKTDDGYDELYKDGEPFEGYVFEAQIARRLLYNNMSVQEIRGMLNRVFTAIDATDAPKEEYLGSLKVNDEVLYCWNAWTEVVQFQHSNKEYTIYKIKEIMYNQMETGQKYYHIECYYDFQNYKWAPKNTNDDDIYEAALEWCDIDDNGNLLQYKIYYDTTIYKQ